MEVVAAVAVGLNPYVAAGMLAVLAAHTTHVPNGPLLGVVPAGALAAVAVFFGLAAAVDLVVGKLLRFAAAARRISRVVAPAAGAVFAAGLAAPDLPLPLVVAGAASTAWLVDVMVGTAAERASRSPAWAGMGHIPVLMAATTVAAVMVPIALVKLPVGYGLATAAIAVLSLTTVGGLVPAARRVLTGWSLGPRHHVPAARQPRLATPG